MKRIDFLDGLRGLAIILVIIYHAYARWPKIVPYGNLYRDFLFFKYGFLGVQLFFLISGFVILMSLEKCNNFFEFIFKRWLRLFPAMFLVTILVYFTSHFLFERPAGIPNISSIIPGIFFIEPNWIELITGLKITPLEGAFWSLFVEFKFYIIFGLLYFFAGKTKAILGIFLMFLLFIVGKKLNIANINTLSDYFSFAYFGWFASGSLAYLFFTLKKSIYIYCSILISLLEVYQYRYDFKLLLFALFILAVFIVPIYFNKFRILLQNKFFLFFGFISYPLYLIHENAMIALICKTSKLFDIPSFLLPIFPIILLVGIAYIISKNIEPILRHLILKIKNLVFLLSKKFAIRF